MATYALCAAAKQSDRVVWLGVEMERVNFTRDARLFVANEGSEFSNREELMQVSATRART